MKYLIVVDMQVDFITGSLGSCDAEAIVPRVAERVRDFDGRVIFTRDTHFADYLATQEGKKLPVPHCIKGSHGWQISSALDTGRAVGIIDKITFGSTELARLLKERENEIESITLIGICTDICVISNAMLIKAALPETPLCVVEKCCAGVTPESHKNALSAMAMCQIDIV